MSILYNSNVWTIFFKELNSVKNVINPGLKLKTEQTHTHRPNLPTHFYYTPLFWLKNLLFIGIIVGLLSGFLVWLFDPSTLPITTVQVEGNSKTSPEALQAAITTYTVGGFFNLEVQALRAVILKLPWVKEALVQRVWPATLQIRLQEYQAVALFQPVDKKEKWMVVSQEGTLFELPVLPTGLPIFTGPSNKVPEMLIYYTIFKSVLETNGLQINIFGCDTRQAWFMVLNKRIRLLVGRGNPDTRLKRFLKVYQYIVPSSFLNQSIQGESAVLYVDLRYTHGIAVKTLQGENYAKR